MKRVLVCVVLFFSLGVLQLGAQKRTLAASANAWAGQRVVTDALFHSQALGRDMKYSLILPRDYERTNRRYPVLYLLHGLHGNHLDWITRTDLARYAEPLEFIIVMPDADDSWYTNSAAVAEDRYEEYIVKDVVAEIDSKYRTLRSRQGRAAAGLSMGGYAAMKFALRYPAQFSIAGSLSGALNAPLDLDATEEYRQQLVKVFGESGSQTRDDNDVFALAKAASPSALPYLFISCGSADQFLNTNRDFVATIQKQKIAYEYHEYPGRHAWDYWDTHIQDFLQVATAVFSRNRMAGSVNGGKDAERSGARSVR